MQYKKYTNHRNRSIQGLRSFKDTLPKNIKRVINKKGHTFSETLNNWRYIVGDELFQICFPKSFKNSNKFNVSTLQVMVKRGHEIDLEYSKKEIISRMNSFFGYTVVEKLKFINFDYTINKSKKYSNLKKQNDVTISKYTDKIKKIKNDKIKNSLIKFVKAFK